MNTPELKAALRAFVAQRPGFDYRNYGTVSAYRADQRRAMNDKADALALINAFPDDAESRFLTDALRSGNRLHLENGELEYTAGQYWCIEYRAAVARALASALWALWAEDVGPGQADTVRKRARATFGRGIQSRYFD